MTYLKSVTTSDPFKGSSSVDEEVLFNLRQKETSDGGHTSIVKATTSVLLTIVLPEESVTNQEELDLLTLPQGLWTIMVVNCHERLAKDMEREPTQYLTPLAQFLRGLTYSLRTQNMNAEAIYDRLKERLRDSDDESLFDDEQFTKSTLYHWTVKTCDELRESLMASQRYMTRAFDRKITPLCEKNAHISGQDGLLYWKAEHEAEMHALEELIAQISALCSSVQESVSRLYPVKSSKYPRLTISQRNAVCNHASYLSIGIQLTRFCTATRCNRRS